MTRNQDLRGNPSAVLGQQSNDTMLYWDSVSTRSLSPRLSVYDQDLLSAVPSGIAVIRRPIPGQLNAKGPTVLSIPLNGPQGRNGT